MRYVHVHVRKMCIVHMRVILVVAGLSPVQGMYMYMCTVLLRLVCLFDLNCLLLSFFLLISHLKTCTYIITLLCTCTCSLISLPPLSPSLNGLYINLQGGRGFTSHTRQLQHIFSSIVCFGLALLSGFMHRILHFCIHNTHVLYMHTQLHVHLRRIFSRKSEPWVCYVALPCLFVCLCLLLSFFLLSSLIKTCTCTSHYMSHYM